MANNVFDPKYNDEFSVARKPEPELVEIVPKAVVTVNASFLYALPPFDSSRLLDGLSYPLDTKALHRKAYGTAGRAIFIFDGMSRRRDATLFCRFVQIHPTRDLAAENKRAILTGGGAELRTAASEPIAGRAAPWIGRFHGVGRLEFRDPAPDAGDSE